MSRPRSSGSFAGVHFGVVSTNIPLISGLELAPICSGFITRSCSLKIACGYLPDFVSTFASARSSYATCGSKSLPTLTLSRTACPESLFAALALPHTLALVE